MQTDKKKARTLWTLFTAMLSISACTFGGGFVIVTLMQRRFVDELHWLGQDEMLDRVALAQAAPGAIAVNAAILLGQRMAGWAGVAAAVMGTVLPPMVILSVISVFYAAFAANPYVAALMEGMQAGVAAVLADVVMRLGGAVVRGKDALALGVMAGAFLAVAVWKVNVIVVILAAAALGAARALRRRGASA